MPHSHRCKSSPHRRTARDRDPQPGQARARCASCSRPTASRRSRPASSASPSPRRPARPSRENARDQGGSRGAGRRGCRRSPTIPASWSMRSAARPASIRRAGRAPTRISRRAMGEIEEKLQRPRRDGAARRARAHFVSALCVAWPDGHAKTFEGRVDGVLVWPPRGDKGFGYDPMFLPDGHDAHLRRDAERGEARPAAARPRPVAPRPRLSSSSRRPALAKLDQAAACRHDDRSPRRTRPSASTSTGRSACRSAPIATSTAMSATPRSTRRASCAPSPPRSRRPRRGRPAARCRRSSSAAARRR